MEDDTIDEKLDIEEINTLLASLAKNGLLPDDSEEALENDIEELFEEELFPSHEYVIMPALGQDYGEYVLCKNWFKKKWEKAKKFVKKHKKAIIIGAAVVVAVTVVTVAVVAASSASAVTAAAGTAGAAASSGSKKTNSNDTPNLNSAFEEKVSSFKENIAKENFFTNEGLSLEETGRILGPLFAHESFNTLNNQVATYPQLSQEMQSIRSQLNFSLPPGASNTPVEYGHSQIDKKFSADYAPLFSASENEADFTALSYQMIGEQALKFGHHKQAVEGFGKAIELNPSDPTLYLQRSAAYFDAKDYEHALNDFHKFTQAPQTYPLSISEFSLGFVKGLPKGVYESGEGIYLFLVDFAKNPIHTSTQIYESLSMLVNLARNDEWGIISETLAPEIHQLIAQWDTLPSDKKGELAGYALGKHGTDIVAPGALAKVASKSAQELSAVLKNLKKAEGTLVLETAAELGNGAKVAKVLEKGQQTTSIAEELGYNGPKIGKLKQAGELETTVTKDFKHLSPAMQKSAVKYKKAREDLNQYKGQYFSETKVRELIHETGIKVPPRPKGIPENFKIKIADKPGILYHHPTNTHLSVRVMPGKPHSPHPYQRNPYVIQKIDGKALDKFGNRVNESSLEAHIPYKEYVYRSK